MMFGNGPSTDNLQLLNALIIKKHEQSTPFFEAHHWWSLCRDIYPVVQRANLNQFGTLDRRASEGRAELKVFSCPARLLL
jgi:hypothetical protein